MLRSCVRLVHKIPRERIEILRSRASGPGGQNINASNCRVQLKFEIGNADWLAPAVADVLTKRFGKTLVISCQDSRSWIENEKDAFSSLQSLLDSIEEELAKPDRRFESFQDYISSVRTEKQIVAYKKRQMDAKKRASLDRRRRRDLD